MSAGHQRMTNDAVPNLDSLDAGPDRLDPARVFVPHDVRKFDVDLAAPNSFDNMEICATDARTADADDHIHRARNLRVCHLLVFDKLLCRQLFIKGMEHRGFHLFISPPRWFFMLWLWRPAPPHQVSQ